MKSLLNILVSLILLSQTIYASTAQSKLSVSFHPSVELLGFGYYLGFESIDIESKTVIIDGIEYPKTAWHNYGYQFSEQYEEYRNSENFLKAISIADHLWLDKILSLLMRLDPVPNAHISDDLNPAYYLGFSKTKDPEEALKNASIFVESLNAFYKEVDFSAFLHERKADYELALEEIYNSLPDESIIYAMEDFYHKTYTKYHLVPSLTIPKGMGFGLRDGSDEIFNIFGALTWQKTNHSQERAMGFNDPQQLRELSVHEFGHSFVGPAISKIPDSIFEQTEYLFEPIKEAMNDQGYNGWKACVDEHFVRAIEIIISKATDTEEAYINLKNAYVDKRQFIYIPKMIPIIQENQRNGIPFYQSIIKALTELSKENRKPNEDNCNLGWHTEDIELFWEVYDSQGSKQKGSIWQSEYLEKGSPGVKGYIPFRIESGKKLAKTISKNKAYYDNVRESSLNLEFTKREVCLAFHKLDSLYKDFRKPEVYFIIGRMNSGGTATSSGVIMGIEMFGNSKDGFEPSNSMDALASIVTHELIHFQQNYAKNNTLLMQSIREGSADFFAELLLDKPIHVDLHVYGDAHEESLKKEFVEKMHTNNWQGWLYGMRDKSRPKDLGYWMGYKIVKAYFDKAEDKNQAIHDILNVQDPKAFLKKSGYMLN